MDNRVTVFREIHKNTWLKRLTIDNKKVTVGSKVTIKLFLYNFLLFMPIAKLLFN